MYMILTMYIGGLSLCYREGLILKPTNSVHTYTQEHFLEVSEEEPLVILCEAAGFTIL